MTGEMEAIRDGETVQAEAGAERISLDLATGELDRGGARVRLRPKTLAVLAILIERRGAVVGQDELRSRVWGTRAGNEAGPKQCIRELRGLLGCSSTEPRCVETVGRSGYRLLVGIEMIGGAPVPPATTALCVGRAGELAALTARAAAADRGARSMVFIAGEPGAGKTRLTDAFLATLSHTGAPWIARGQCVPHAEAREPYGPLIEILSELAAGPLGPRVRPLLRDGAPNWRAQIPALAEPETPARSLTDVARNSADRMPREFTDLMERLTRQAPGILVLEDLHWADARTLAWLTAWGMRRAPARLLIIGTYRADEADAAGDLGTALRVLARQGGVETLPLGGLDTAAVADYLARRFPGHRFPEVLARALTARTEGHALLVDAVVEQWAGRDIQLIGGAWELLRSIDDLVADIAPDLRALITHQIEALDPNDRRLLGAASVVGPRFSGAALASGRVELEDVERRLEALARRGRFIEGAGAVQWPDGTVAASYAFRHALYHEALYDLVPAANRQGLHRRIGARLEAALGAGAKDHAPMLADHFERAGDWRRAALYRGHSGAAALARGAAQEAAAEFRQALSLHGRRVEDERETAKDAELDALLGLGAALIVCEGFTATDLPAVYRRAHDLSTRVVDPGKAIPALAGLWNYHVSRADMAVATALAEDLLRLTAEASAPLRMAAHNAAGLTKWFTGAPRSALPHIEAVLALHEEGVHAGAAALFGEEPGIVCLHYAACVHQILGDGAEAERLFEAGMKASERPDQAFGRAQMLWSGTVIARERGDPARVLEHALSLLEVCQRADIAFWIPAGDLMAGWAKAILGDPAGLVQLRAGLDAYARMEVLSTLPYSLGLLAEASARHGDLLEARRALARAIRIARASGERWYEPELRRLRGDLSLLTGRAGGARRAFQRARARALAQGATPFAKRAAARLAELPPTVEASAEGKNPADFSPVSLRSAP
jgi:DNA-binding winged helix-turn-helix (wHTH) protein